MVLWTVMPADVVYVSDYTPAYEEAEFNGTTVFVEKISPTECRIVRIISTNPEDYLRAELQPGTVLTYKPMLTIA